MLGGGILVILMIAHLLRSSEINEVEEGFFNIVDL
jgi:hypothetical protein